MPEVCCCCLPASEPIVVFVAKRYVVLYCDEVIHPTARVSERVNTNCRPMNTILQLLTFSTDHIPSNFHLLNHRCWCHPANKLKLYCEPKKTVQMLQITVVSMQHGYSTSYNRLLLSYSWFSCFYCSLYTVVALYFICYLMRYLVCHL